MPPRPRTRRPGPCIPLSFVSRSPRHRQRRQEEPGSEGPEPLRHRAPAGRGKGRRALIPAPLLALRGREAGGSGRRVSSPSASQLTAPKQPFLKANCHRRSEPPPAPRPALGGGSAGVTAPPSRPRPPLLSSPAHAARRGAGGAAAGTGMQPPEPGAPARPMPCPRALQPGLRPHTPAGRPGARVFPLCRLAASARLRSCKVHRRFCLELPPAVAEEMLQLVVGASPS